MSILGDNLRLLRENKRLSQTELAKTLKISNKSLSVYERAVAEPDIDTLILFANFFDISIDNLVGRKIPVNEPAPEDRELINTIKELKPEDKQILKDLAKSFIRKYVEEKIITKASK